VIFPHGAAQRMDHEAAAEVFYDAVVVGSGISGAIVASELSRAGHRVLILEAGPGEDATLKGYEDYLERFYATPFKDNQSPYPVTPDRSRPDATRPRRPQDPPRASRRVRLHRAERPVRL